MTPETVQIQVSAISDVLKTEEAICFIKDNFSKRLANELNLTKVSAPIAVLDVTGINDEAVRVNDSDILRYNRTNNQ